AEPMSGVLWLVPSPPTPLPQRGEGRKQFAPLTPGPSPTVGRGAGGEGDTAKRRFQKGVWNRAFRVPDTLLKPSLSRKRQLDAERRAGGPRLLQLDPPAVAVDDLTTDRQPEPCALRAGGEERLEQVRAGLVGDARPRVADADHDRPAAG